MYTFDRYPYLKHSTAGDTPPAKPIQLVAGEFHARIHELDDHQLAAIYLAIEAEHVNRMAVVAGYTETLDEVF